MTSADSAVTRAFLEFSRAKLAEEYWPRLRACVDSLTSEQLWWRPNEASNSVGNLLLHLNGNVHQWLVASFEGGADDRDRPSEFAARTAASADVLLQQLESTIERASEVLLRLDADDLAATLNIQGYTVTGLHAVYHVVEHFGMHYGQIVYVTKLLRETNLGFYRELDATGRV